MAYNECKDNINKYYTNEELRKFYKEKNNLMNAYYQHTELTANNFFATIFDEANVKGLLVDDYEFDGKANGKMVLYSPKLSRSIHFKKNKAQFVKARKKLVLTGNNISNLTIEGLNGVLASTNLHYGLKKDSLAYVCNIDIDFDGIYSDYDLLKLINLFEDGKMLPPTVLVSSGTGVHLIYRLDKPIRVYNDNYLKDALRGVKAALCKKLECEYGFQSQFMGKIKPLALDQLIRCPGSTTKLGEMASSREEALDNICRAWHIGDSYSILDLIEYAEENLNQAYYVLFKSNDADAFIEEINLALEFDQQIVKMIKSGNKSYYWVNKNLYAAWLKRCKEEVYVGSRYYGMLGLVSYALKCNVKIEQLKKDLQELMNYYNNRDTEKITEDDIEAALKGYYDENLKYLKGETIAKRCGLSVSHKKRNHLPQSEHLKKARKDAGRKSKKKELEVYLFNLLNSGHNVRNMSLRDISKETGISKTTVGKYIKILLQKLYYKKNININKLLNDRNPILFKPDFICHNIIRYNIELIEHAISILRNCPFSIPII